MKNIVFREKCVENCFPKILDYVDLILQDIKYFILFDSANIDTVWFTLHSQRISYAFAIYYYL